MPGIRRWPASSDEQARGAQTALPSEPTVSGGRREAACSLGGSLKQDPWVVAKVTVALRHPCESEGVLLTVTGARRHRQASMGGGGRGRLCCLGLAYCSNQPGGPPPFVCS